MGNNQRSLNVKFSVSQSAIPENNFWSSFSKTFNLQPTNLDIYDNYDMNISHRIPLKIALTLTIRAWYRRWRWWYNWRWLVWAGSNIRPRLVPAAQSWSLNSLSPSRLIWNVYFEVRTRQLLECTMAFMDCERNQLLLSNLNIAETAFESEESS